MDEQAINKELTELLGEYWHDYKKPCDANIAISQNDFFTNEGCGKLRDYYSKWDIKAEARFWEYIKKIQRLDNQPSFNRYRSILYVFHRDNLAPLMLEFLKQEGK